MFFEFVFPYRHGAGEAVRFCCVWQRSRYGKGRSLLALANEGFKLLGTIRSTVAGRMRVGNAEAVSAGEGEKLGVGAAVSLGVGDIRSAAKD